MVKRLGALREALLVNENPFPIRQSRWPVKGTSTAAAITGDVTLAAADSGKLITIDFSSVLENLTITLPTPEVGLRYTFVLVTVGDPDSDCVFQVAAAGQTIGGQVQYNYDGNLYTYMYRFDPGDELSELGFSAGTGPGDILDLVCVDTSVAGINWMVCRGYFQKTWWPGP